jgi:YfiH family protein
VADGFQWNEEAEAVFLHLPLLKGVRHAFCTRAGEQGPLTHFGIPPERLLTLRQVHGAEVLIFSGDTKVLTPRPRPGETGGGHPQPYDAVITGKKDIALGIWTADCLPILMIDRSKKVIAAVHAGWRGIWRGVIGRTVAKMHKAFESSPPDILAGIGPGIGPCCYEVKEDVASLFQNSPEGPDQFIQEREGRTYLDLGRAAQLELTEVGIPPENIQAIPLCTACREDLFFSYRRDKRPGRQLSFIML